MNRRASIAAIAMVLMTIAPSLAIAQQPAPRPRIAVISFRNRTSWWGAQLGASAASQLTTKLVNAGAFTVIERERLKDITNEQFLGQTGAVDQTKAAQLGKLLGVEYLVTGEFQSFDIHRRGGNIPGVGGFAQTTAESSINIRAFSVNTGEIVFAAQGGGTKRLGSSGVFRGQSYADTIGPGMAWNPTMAEDALSDAIEKIATDMTNQRSKFASSAVTTEAKATPSGPSIAGFAADGSIYIDQGQNVGLLVGRRFHVLHVVDVIKDAKGNELDKVTKRVGVIEVTQVLARSAVCKVVEGQKPDPKDLLEPQ